MSSNFAFRYVSLTPEHNASSSGARTYGTASATAAAQVFGEVDDESFAHMFDLLTRADMSRFGSAKSLNGKEHSEGGVNLVAQGDDFCGMLLYAAYGDNATANSTKYNLTSNTHTFREGLDHILPSFTVKVGREDKEHTYTGMTLSRLAISAAVNEYVTMSADFMGKAESAQGSLTAAVTYNGATSDGMHFADGTIKFSSDGNANSVTTTIKSISFEINTNLNTDDACSLGSQTYTRQPEPQMREITGTVEFSRPQMVADTSTDAPSYAQITASDGLLYTGDLNDAAIEATFATPGSGNMIFRVVKCRWDSPGVTVSGRDSSTMTCNFTALYDTTAECMSQAVITTDASTIGRYSTI